MINLSKNDEPNVVMTPYLATAIAEGFCEGEGASERLQLQAWAYLIKTDLAWEMQGWFGRHAMFLIEEDIISSDGVINWDNTNLNL